MAWVNGPTEDSCGQISDGVLVAKTCIYKNQILSRISLSTVYKNKILSRVSLSKIYKNKILSRVSLSRIYKNKILVSIPQVPTAGTTRRKQNKFRNYIRSLAFGLKDFFKIKQREPEPEDVPIPEPQPPKIFHILPEPPTTNTKLETLNDKWSVVASTPPPVLWQSVHATGLPYDPKPSNSTAYPNQGNLTKSNEINLSPSL